MMASSNSNYLYISEKDLHNKLLTQEQRNMFIRFIDSINGDNELKNELKYLVDDYNKVIFSAIHLIQEKKNNLINVSDNMQTKSFTNSSDIYNTDKNYSTITNFSSTNLNFKHYPIEESKYNFINPSPIKIEENNRNYNERKQDYRAYTSENSEGNNIPKFDSNLIKIKKNK